MIPAVLVWGWTVVVGSMLGNPSTFTPYLIVDYQLIAMPGVTCTPIPEGVTWPHWGEPFDLSCSWPVSEDARARLSKAGTHEIRIMPDGGDPYFGTKNLSFHYDTITVLPTAPTGVRPR